ncbi:sulfotransferase family 2 domain-containing protein [Sphingosinicella rhizophila]|uniref:Sulfotransferase family 2 domain-containing protein n=1 Tax=Sphingosinicella rhizophila TaxID=3050082 RepID=A0ABU3Q659_9SPHN|nr:sulfotransferase family 2 domain-containing protein [Sphingosinicella sp. GR2756]MDT9598891.1 sulfotransferase family 2 domain-containing protein [Sphingosinicella sp. GR2756]
MNSVLRNAYRHLPEELRRAVLVRRRARLWLRAGIVFVHVPKAAGTSINLALYGRFVGHPHASDICRWAPSEVRALPLFSVVRNPWDRLVSAYRFVRRGVGIGEARAGIWKSERYQVPEFRSFEIFVKDWLARRDIVRLDGVFRPQWLFVCDSDRKPLPEHIGRLEDLAPTYDFIRQNLGAAPHFAHTNLSGEAVDYRKLYTPDLVRQVGDLYAEDISIFRYDF